MPDKYRVNGIILEWNDWVCEYQYGSGYVLAMFGYKGNAMYLCFPQGLMIVKNNNNNNNNEFYLYPAIQI